MKPPNNMNNIIIFAFRYGLTRNTGAPLMIANFIKKNIDVLTIQDIKEIINDIESCYRNYSQSPISTNWNDLKRWLIARQEIKKE